MTDASVEDGPAERGRPRSGAPRPAPFRAVVEVAATVVGGTALLWLVVRAGQPGWQVARAVAVAAVTSVVARAVWRWWGRRRGAVCLVAGVAATAAGTGLVAQWLPEGTSAVAVAAVALTAAGAVLVVAGTVDVVVAGPGRRGWLVVPAVLVALVLAAEVLTVPVAATNVPPGAAPPSTVDLAGRRATTLRFDAGHGAELAGWWVPPRNGATVVVVPGSGSTRAAAGDQAEVLVEAGYGVLVVDPRGHGASTGTAMDLGWWGDDDLRGAVDAVVRRPDVDPDRIAVLGLSMGGEEAIGAAAADPRVRAVVAEGVTGRTAADHAWLSEEFGLRGAVQEQLSRASSGVADLLTAASPPTALADGVRDASSARFLLVAAGDVDDEVRVARRLRRVAPGRVQVWVVLGAGHTGGLGTAPREWRERVLGFLGGGPEGS